VSGSRVVDALAVITVTGMLIATVAMLVANRILPADLPQRGDWEEYSFWAAWVLAMGHAFWRTAPVLQAPRLRRRGRRKPRRRVSCRLPASERGRSVRRRSPLVTQRGAA